jgi:hypothetical protein
MLYTHVSSGTGAVGQTVCDVPSGLSLTPAQENKKSEIFCDLVSFNSPSEDNCDD